VTKIEPAKRLRIFDEHGISYRLANGKCGNITDPELLRIFYSRIAKK
jgi:hypothetical protein